MDIEVDLWRLEVGEDAPSRRAFTDAALPLPSILAGMEMGTGTGVYGWGGGKEKAQGTDEGHRQREGAGGRRKGRVGGVGRGARAVRRGFENSEGHQEEES